MPWWGWLLIYTGGAFVAFRSAYLIAVEKTQRYKVANPYQSQYIHKKQHEIRLMTVGVVTAIWPLVLVAGLFYLLARSTGKGIFWVLFPRGVKTKFDREQQLEREKKEAEIKYQEAKALLEQEGIKVQ